ncbi:MAG: PAS domain S-box protein [Alphaproteobacteria bacterium]
MVTAHHNLETLLQLAPDPMLVADSNGMIVASNRQLDDLFGYDTDDLVGQSVEILMPPGLRSGHGDKFASFVRAPATRLMGDRELQGWTRDGNTFPCEISLTPLRDEDVFHVIAAVRDISRRKQIERRLRETEEQIELIFAASPEAYILVSTNGRVRTCNSAANRLFGVDGELNTRDLDITTLFFAGEDSPEAFRHDFRQCCTSGNPVIREAIVTPPGKGSFEAEYTLTPLAAEDGTFETIFIICRDLSHRKQAERNLRTQKDRAEAALQELQTTRAHLYDAQRQAALGRTVSGVAHEIRNPLNFIRNYAESAALDLEALRDLVADRSDATAEIDLIRDDIEKVRTHSLRLENVIRSMMLLARKDRGPVEQFRINRLLQETADFAVQARSRANSELGDVLRFNLDQTDPGLQGRPPELARAFLNLIENGLYALRERKAKDAAFVPELSISSLASDDTVTIEIRDNGTGMPDEVRSNLFTPFLTTKPSGEGTGLGLSISHETIVTEHLGKIDVESKDGSFTQFSIRLPRTMRTDSPTPQDDQAEDA